MKKTFKVKKVENEYDKQERLAFEKGLLEKCDDCGGNLLSDKGLDMFWFLLTEYMAGCEDGEHIKEYIDGFYEDMNKETK